MLRPMILGVGPWLFWLGGCSPDQVVLMIHVTNLTPDVTGLQVRAQLDDRPSQQVTYAQKLDTLAVTISKDSIGQGQLSLSVLGVGSSGCSSTGAQHNETVELNSPYLEIDLPLEPLTHRLCKVPKGSFIMGSPTMEVGRGTDEVQHMVTLTTDFWMSDSEVTQKQYRNLTGDAPSMHQGGDYPVEMVSWFDAVAYCNALSVKEKLTPCYQINGTTVGWADGVKCTGYRLPTEAEWEYAANPASPPRTIYAGADTADGVAWHSGNAANTTHAVKTKTANGRGLYDLSGNVWEWVWDFYQANYEALPPTNPIGPSTGTSRVIRGGSWIRPASYARVAQRLYTTPANRDGYLGFRFVRSYP
jgi:formylglycine-generating enzyme required for sulfatase activity